MKVYELIDLLAKCPPKANVVISYWGEYGEAESEVRRVSTDLRVPPEEPEKTILHT